MADGGPLALELVPSDFGGGVQGAISWACHSTRFQPTSSGVTFPAKSSGWKRSNSRNTVAWFLGADFGWHPDTRKTEAMLRMQTARRAFMIIREFLPEQGVKLVSTSC